MARRRRSGGRRRRSARRPRFWGLAVALVAGAGLVVLAVLAWRRVRPAAGPRPIHLRISEAPPHPPEEIGASERARLEGILEELEATPGTERRPGRP